MTKSYDYTVKDRSLRYSARNCRSNSKRTHSYTLNMSSDCHRLQSSGFTYKTQSNLLPNRFFNKPTRVGSLQSVEITRKAGKEPALFNIKLQ